MNATPLITTSPDVERLIAMNAAVGVGVSGGKDSVVAAFETIRYLDTRGHAGPRILIHSDLGRVEWRDSLPTCERLAVALGVELMIVKRERGDMMDRWLQRFHDNLARYQAMETVQLILPWSTPSMRFCTSELKTAIICRNLINRFPNMPILSVAGIRREESTARSKAEPSKAQPRLTSKTKHTSGLDWLPILDYQLADVWRVHERECFAPHMAYAGGNTRVSCVFCIMSSRPDLLASSRHPDNLAIYREMVDLEIVSAFAFQDSGWLGDVAPHLLDADQLAGLRLAKERAALRQAVEARIPSHLRFTKNWPEWLPTAGEAQILAEARQTLAGIYNVTMQYITPESIIERYAAMLVDCGKPLRHFAGGQPTQLGLLS